MRLPQIFCSLVAQLEERWPSEPSTAGSSPAEATFHPCAISTENVYLMKILALTVSYLNENKLKSKWIDLFYSSLYSHSDEIEKYDHLVVLNETDSEKAKENILERKEKYDFQEYSLHFEENDSLFHPNGVRIGVEKLREDFSFSEYDFVILHEFDVALSADFVETVENLRPVLKNKSTIVGEVGLFSFWESKIQPERLQPSFLLFHSRFSERFLTFIRNNINSEDYEDFQELRELIESDCVDYDMNVDVGSGLYRSLFYRRYNVLSFHSDNIFNHIKGISLWFDRIIKEKWDNEDTALKKLKHKFDYVKRKYKELDFSSDSVFKKEKEEVFSEVEEAYL